MKKLLYVLLMLSLVLAFGAANGNDEGETAAAGSTMKKEAPPEGAATNNGYPYNLKPVKYDSRDDKYLYGINGTILPIAEGFTMDIWRSFNSTVMQGQDESAAMQAMEEATGIEINWVYPPVGQERDNFNLRVSSNDLPHVFSNPPAYPGGFAKAIDDEVLVDCTPYYDQGLMPNIQYLRETRADINRDIVDDDGRIYKFPVMDIIPTDPWSGMWVREDWLKKMGMDLPTTIDDWDKMLYAMKENYGVAPLGIAINIWYGVSTNYAFAGSYESAYEWMHKDGQAYYGPIQPGYKDFLALLNKWYEDGLIDPDFATRDQSSYNALMANGGYGAMGMAYGDVGQAKITGASIDPDYKLTPVLQPTSYPGQEIHLHQDNSTVRSNANYVAIRSLDEGVVETVVQWLDFNFSQYGGDLCSYGPEGVSMEWKADGEYEWIHPSLDNDEGLDFWTVYPLFKMHAWGSLRNSASYEMEQEVWDCIELWDSQDSSWIIPDNIAHTPEESRELSNIMTDINTYRDEMTLKFIVGQEPIENFDNFVATIEKMNIAKATELKTAALKRYFAR